MHKSRLAAASQDRRDVTPGPVRREMQSVFFLIRERHGGRADIVYFRDYRRTGFQSRRIASRNH